MEAAALASLESQSRYITRPSLAMDALRKLEDGHLALETPPDPRTGATRVVLDPLEWIHRITAHIPDPGSHCQRFYKLMRTPTNDAKKSGCPRFPRFRCVLWAEFDYNQMYGEERQLIGEF